MSFLIAQVASTTPLKFPPIEYSAIAPELIMVVGAIAVLLVSSLVPRHISKAVSITLGSLVALVSLADSIYLAFQSGSPGADKAVLAGAVALDKFAVFFYVLFSIVALLTLLAGRELMNLDRGRITEFVILVLLSTSGAMLMASALDLIVLFLGLEILSISLYVLVAMESDNDRGRESSIKYFMLGGFSSAIFLYGVALVYGATGSTNLGQIFTFLANNLLKSNGVLLAGMGMILVGLGFKISAVPFHFWAPDVYQGAPSPVTGFMAATAKAAGFAALLRVFYSGFIPFQSDWVPLIGVIAGFTMLVGAVLAVVQTDVKRTLAYSSINQAGFILLGLYAASARGVGASLYFLITYSVVIVGAFATVGAIEKVLGKSGVQIEDLRGLSKKAPFLAFSFVTLILAQAGAPFTTGFLAKFNVVLAAVSSKHYPVALIAMISAAIAVFFYLRMALMPFRSVSVGAESSAEGGMSLEDSQYGGDSAVMVKEEISIDVKSKLDSATVVIAAAVIVTIGLGIWAGPLISIANRAVLLF
ncbi:MAG: NADH-quinone oxidoreductase subunit N [Candidatus Marsarchaeota archaeon]|nr:NADH-quinone oxidoreductase subunit N [Candidatus Marsarchaeota archaeon]